MRVLLITWGSRGDIQPFVALGETLRTAGHDVVLCASASAKSLAESRAITFAPLYDVVGDFLRDPDVREALETNLRGLRGTLLTAKIMRVFRPAAARMHDDMARAATEHGADIVVHQPGAPGREIAEKLGVPAVPVCLSPIWVPTTAFPNPLLPYATPKALNRLTYLWTRLWFWGFNGSLGRWRAQTLALSSPRRRRDPLRRPDGSPATVLQAFSRHLLPASSSYPSRVHTTGYWYLPAPSEWTPPSDLVEFVESDAPPLYIGFGSSLGTEPAEAGRIVAAAVRRTGVRAVIGIASGGIRIDSPGSEVFCLDEAPFDWLFPRMAGVVHHGGAGTTGLALVAGRPQLICPQSPNQSFSARRLPACGVAAPSIYQRDLTVDRLATAIAQLTSDQRLARQAEELAHRVRAEAGATAATRILEQEARSLPRV